MKEFFKPYKNHSAVENFKSLRKRGFTYDAPPVTALYFSNLQNTPFTDYILERGSGEKKTERDLGEDFFKIKFKGPINGAFPGNTEKILIVPTGESDEKANNSIAEYLKMIRNKFFKDSKIITDKEALGKDLSDYNIIAYGTLEGNLWLKDYKSGFPFSVNNEMVKADKEYSGNNLKFISALPNPQNIDNALLVYTAQKPESIININDVYHGSTDYIIFKSREFAICILHNHQLCCIVAVQFSVWSFESK